MKEFEGKSYPIFDLFQNQWGLVTAGSIDRYNCCTVSWGSMGTIWERPGHCCSTITVYIHPARYTCGFMKESEYFTLSFFPENYRKALAYLGSHSGRDGDKVAAAGLSPRPIGEGVRYEEAELTFLCRKLYQQEFSKESLSEDVREYYATRPKAFPPDENGIWHAHWLFMGEIVDVIDRR